MSTKFIFQMMNAAAQDRSHVFSRVRLAGRLKTTISTTVNISGINANNMYMFCPPHQFTENHISFFYHTFNYKTICVYVINKVFYAVFR